MVDSSMVLWGQTIIYTVYVLAIMALMAWFAFRVTREAPKAPGEGGENRGVKPALFYSFVGLLIVIGISLHIVTYETIPWAAMDFKRASIAPDKTFDIHVAGHRFQLPDEKLRIRCGEKVLFNVTSGDLTYGFGLFRPDHSLVFQMQVLPGHRNDILWRFDKPGLYSIRSTEYSGPVGALMIVPDAVEVTCSEAEEK